MTTFEQVLPIADTVLYEGYMLYPYRADDPKNQVRWQFGVLMPPSWVEADPSERSFLQTELLLDGRVRQVATRLRLLQVQRRTVQRRVDGSWTTVPGLDAGDAVHRPFDEGVPHDIDLAHPLAGLLEAPAVELLEVSGGTATEPLPGGRLLRERLPLAAQVTISAQLLPGPYRTVRLRVRVENRSTWRPDKALRSEGLRAALVAAHLLVRVDGGRLLSLTDPPEWASGYAAGCVNEGVWPVLCGEGRTDDLVLCSPIILPDHPEVAPESTTQFCDALELDELLSLRTMTLTDEEKRVVRGTDPRAAALLDQVDGLPGELLDRLHGAVRSLTAMPVVEPVSAAGAEEGHDVSRGPAPGPDAEAGAEAPLGVEMSGAVVSTGSRVILRPGVRSADAQDLFLSGRTATVAKVMHDVDGRDHLAVLLDDDPGQDIARVHGRYLYFAPDEVEPVDVNR